jgi:hypothetical protein
MPTRTLYPTADSYIVSGQGALGASTIVVAGRLNVLNSPLEARPLLRFDLGAYAAVELATAVLRLTVSSIFMPDAGHNLKLYDLTSTWVEAGATWTARGTGGNWTTAGGDFSPTEQGSAGVSDATTVLDVNVLTAAQAALGGEVNWLARIIDGAGALSHLNHYAVFHSRTAVTVSFRPQLLLTYTLGQISKGAPLPARRSFTTLPGR